MAWMEVPPNRQFVLCMAFDNQVDTPPRTHERLLRTYPVFFETIVLNRMYILNDPNLRQLFKQRDDNHIHELLAVGGVTLISAGRDLVEDWELAHRDGPAGVTSDRKFVEDLAEDLEALPLRVVQFDLAAGRGAQGEDRAPAARFFSGICQIWSRIGDDFKGKWVLAPDRERMDQFFGPASVSPAGFLRGRLLFNPDDPTEADQAAEWSLGIPIMPAAGGNPLFDG